MGHPEPDQADAGTHTVVASFVVFILGLYMNGEFWQEGTLQGKNKEEKLLPRLSSLFLLHNGPDCSPDWLL